MDKTKEVKPKYQIPTIKSMNELSESFGGYGNLCESGSVGDADDCTTGLHVLHPCEAGGLSGDPDA
jgi:hypothetical protein